MSLKDTFFGWFTSSTTIGASAPGKPVKPIPYPKGKKTQGIATHGKVLRAARAQLGKSQGVLTKAAQTLAKAPRHAPSKVAGAAAHPAVKAQIAKHAQAVTRSGAASKKLAQTILAGKRAMANLAQKMVHQKKIAVSMRRPKGGSGTTVGHLERYAELIGGHELHPAEVHELIGLDGDGGDPGQPSDDSSSGDPSAGLLDSPVGQAIDDGQVSFPAPPDMATGFRDMTQVGGIAYDGSKGFPDGFAGSLGLFTRATDRGIAPMTAEIDGNEHHGFVFGQYDWKDPRFSGFGKDSGGANKQPGGGIPWGSSLRTGLWNWVHGRHEMGSEDWHTDVPDPGYIFSAPFDPGAPAQYKNAYGQPFGPIVGNPSMADFRAMRCDAAGNYFWLPQEAPDWVTFPLKQAAALTAKAAADARAAAQAAASAAAAKIAADAQVAAAQQAADLAAAQSSSAIQQSQAEGQAAQVLVQQGQAQAQQMQSQADEEQQAGQLLLEQARQQMAQQRAPADDTFSPADTTQDTGVDERTADDGSAPDDAAQMTDAEIEEAGLS